MSCSEDSRTKKDIPFGLLHNQLDSLIRKLSNALIMQISQTHLYVLSSQYVLYPMYQNTTTYLPIQKLFTFLF